jgi:hypothetical protein
MDRTLKPDKMTEIAAANYTNYINHINHINYA